MRVDDDATASTRACGAATTGGRAALAASVVGARRARATAGPAVATRSATLTAAAGGGAGTRVENAWSGAPWRLRLASWALLALRLVGAGPIRARVGLRFRRGLGGRGVWRRRSLWRGLCRLGVWRRRSLWRGLCRLGLRRRR